MPPLSRTKRSQKEDVKCLAANMSPTSISDAGFRTRDAVVWHLFVDHQREREPRCRWEFSSNFFVKPTGSGSQDKNFQKPGVINFVREIEEVLWPSNFVRATMIYVSLSVSRSHRSRVMIIFKEEENELCKELGS